MAGIRLKLKRLFLDEINSHLNPQIPPILIASMGRSGSTLLFDAVAEALISTRNLLIPRAFAKALIRRGGAWNLRTIRFFPGVVYKTHGFPDHLPENFTGKIIFIYGDPIDAALSIINCRDKLGEMWFSSHLTHLFAKESFLSDDNDPFQFSRQIQSWMNYQGSPVLVLRYETLWDYTNKISEFLGFNISLPPRKARSNISESELDVARYIDAYTPLRAQMLDLPDVYIYTPLQ
ncbi:Hypothetical protein SynRCC307_0198 [Synechococcus sp. RCC307]|nr:Hypothetical protein SynRCC307_0198 [Synechococcus sp. RCC307]